VTSNRRSIGLNFYITQHIRDIQLMKTFKIFFNGGTFSYDRSTVTFRVHRFDTNYNTIIPFFTKYKIRGIKNLNFKNGVEIAELIKDKKHLTLEGYNKIINVRNKMNSFRLTKKV